MMRSFDISAPARIVILFTAWVHWLPAAAERGLDLTIATAHPSTVPWVYVIRDYLLPEFSAQMAEQIPDLPVRWTEA
ncbi:MAG: hypothetical protein VX929_13420, partial [Pseudomonadota bacterium]|nr:hypothetical protein [Pseudomonadota bacterium]